MVGMFPQRNLSQQILIAINSQDMVSNPVAINSQDTANNPAGISNQDMVNNPVAINSLVGISRDHMELLPTELRAL